MGVAEEEMGDGRGGKGVGGCAFFICGGLLCFLYFRRIFLWGLSTYVEPFPSTLGSVSMFSWFICVQA